MVRLGVPLGQGYLLGRPTDEMAPVAPLITRQIRQLHARSEVRQDISALQEPLPTVPVDELAGHTAK